MNIFSQDRFQCLLKMQIEQIMGISILTQWHNAVVNIDKSSIANQTTDALGNFCVVEACFGLVQPYITNCKCRQWFADTHIGF